MNQSKPFFFLLFKFFFSDGRTFTRGTRLDELLEWRVWRQNAAVWRHNGQFDRWRHYGLRQSEEQKEEEKWRFEFGEYRSYWSLVLDGEMSLLKIWTVKLSPMALLYFSRNKLWFFIKVPLEELKYPFI